MHEFAVTEELLTVTLEHAKKANAGKVLQINLVIGDLTGLAGESIRFYFNILAEGTIAEESLINISRVPARVRCERCTQDFAPKADNWRCPVCDGYRGNIICGREFYVDSIEIDEKCGEVTNEES